jgi:hypothetical protein
MPVIDLSQHPFYVNRDIHAQGGAYKGAIDEIKFYDYPLSQEEVREKMHLIQKYPALENGLLKYFQFNQYNGSTGKVPDLMSDFEATVPNTSFITASTAPVATGKVFRKPDVSTAGVHSFPGTGIDLILKSSATYPNGEVVAFRLNAAPDQNPGTFPLVPASNYFIINNYGSNKTFTAPDLIQFTGLNVEEPIYGPTDFRLYTRATGASGNTWGNELSHAAGFGFMAGNSSLIFLADNNVTTFGQFALSATSAQNRSFSDMASELNTVPNDDASPTVEFYPNPNKGWGYLNISSSHSNGHVTLYLNDMNGHTVYQTSEQLRDGDKTSLMLNLSGLSSGIYILHVRFNSGELITKKVTVVK